MFNIAALKAAMKEAGFVVSAGADLSAKDMGEFYHYAYRFFGLSKAQAGTGLAYPSTVSSSMPGHPDNPNTPKVEAVVEVLGSTTRPNLPNWQTTNPVTYDPPTTDTRHFNDNLSNPTVPVAKSVPGELVETPTPDLE